MRVLIVNSGLRYGGAETQIIELSKEFIRRGHSVAIYTLTRDVPRCTELEGTGIQVVVDDKRSRLDFRVLKRLRRFMVGFKPDIVHGFLYDGNLYSRLASIGLGIPVLNSERSDNYTLSSAQKWGQLLTRHLADGLIANTWAGREFARQLFRLPDDRMHVVWNGIRLEDVSARIQRNTLDYRKEFFGDDKDVRIACLVGTLIPSKDYLLALEVAARLIKNDGRWRVLFIGASFENVLSYKCSHYEKVWEYGRQVQQRFEELGLPGKIVFASQRNDALEIMSQCDVLYSTSVHEGFPNVVLEAMSVGLPAVAVEYSDIRRVLPFAWQVADREPEALATAIQHAFATRQATIERQMDWVQANATIDSAASAMENVYRCYLGRSSA